MKSHRLLNMLASVGVVLGMASPAGAVVRHVDSDASPGGDGQMWATAYVLLSDALAAAQPGDQVWVAGGRYVGNFTLALDVELYGGFAGTETELAQRDWGANLTILDGNASGSVVTGPYQATATTRIDGFTITNGSGTRWGYPPTCGGGLFLFKSDPTITNNTISGNRVGGGGGGLCLVASSPTIRNNTILGNRGNYLGGGLYMENSKPTIANNIIMGNQAASFGGGLYVTDYSAPVIANNGIIGNHARFGGGLYVSLSSLLIANSTVVGNSASQDGGGVCLSGSSATIANTIVAFNSSGICRFEGTSKIPSLWYNCVYENSAYDYSGLPDPTGLDGNISADPRLADLRYGNVHIQPNSPCVDGGSIAEAFGEFDMDGEARIQPLGGTVDIGADESDGTVWPAGPYGIVRVSPAGSDANNGSSWDSAKRTVQAGIDTASVLGAEVWVQAGTYEERITLHPYAYVYGGFAGSEAERDERDWTANVTILDGQQQGTVVTAMGGHRAASTIDGFTITNGNTRNPISGLNGGGLFVSGASPTIANNTITDNRAGGYGGGLYLSSSFSTIVNNTISSNDRTGVYLSYSSVSVANNTITDNSGDGLSFSHAAGVVANNTVSYNLRGLYLGYSSPTIVHNRITANGPFSAGGGLCLESSHPMIVSNVVAGNSADLGGGLYMNFSSPMIVNNTITGNGADFGGGLCLDSSSSPTIVNTIIAFNASSGIYRWATNNTPVLRYNCVYGNVGRNYSNMADATGTTGNISADPLFVRNPDDGGDGWGDDASTPGVDEGANDDFGDVQLSSGSPCIDAGDNEAVPDDTADLDGDGIIDEALPIDLAGGARFVDDPRVADTGSGAPPIVDMGAYEHLGKCGNGVVDIGEECDDGTTNSDTEPDACRTCCTVAGCGDGVVDSGEDCDDGNTEPDDGCDPGCHFYLGDHCLMPIVASRGTKVGANTSFGADDREASCRADSNHDAWFAYAAPCTATHVISTQGTVLEPTNDTVLSVYDACDGTEIACDDNGGAGELSELTFEAAAGTTYYIRVAGVGDNVGQIVLHISTVGRCLQVRDSERVESSLRRQGRSKDRVRR